MLCKLRSGLESGGDDRYGEDKRPGGLDEVGVGVLVLMGPGGDHLGGEEEGVGCCSSGEVVGCCRVTIPAERGEQEGRGEDDVSGGFTGGAEEEHPARAEREKEEIEGVGRGAAAFHRVEEGGHGCA